MQLTNGRHRDGYKLSDSRQFFSQKLVILSILNCIHPVLHYSWYSGALALPSLFPPAAEVVIARSRYMSKE